MCWPMSVWVRFSTSFRIYQSVKINWYYNERHHGKGPMDGVGGTIQNIVYHDVMSNKCVINNAKAFAQYANGLVNGISSIYLSESELLVKSEQVSMALKIPENFTIHKLSREFDERVCFIKFFSLASDKKSFFT